MAGNFNSPSSTNLLNSNGNASIVPDDESALEEGRVGVSPAKATNTGGNDNALGSMAGRSEELSIWQQSRWAWRFYMLDEATV